MRALYPVCSTDEDFRIQELIDQDLENARDLLAAFEAKYPPNTPPAAINFLARARERPTVAALFPGVARAKPKDWLSPLLRRLRWLTDRRPAERKERDRVAEMVNVLIAGMPRAGEEEILELAAHADCFVMPPVFGYLQRMLEFLRKLEKQGPLSDSGTRALRGLFEFAREIYGATRAWEGFVWPLFRVSGGFAAYDRCWAAAVRRDMETLDAETRDQWLAAFDGKHEGPGGACEPSNACLAAVKSLGKERLESGLRRWIGMLRDGRELHLSPAGMTIFRHTLLLCEKLGGTACDDLLYGVASAPWRREEDAGWVGTHVWILGRRPRDRAFACLEALTMNPATAIDEARREYDAALSTFANEAHGTGVDGYVWASAPDLEDIQRRLERLLEISKLAVENGPYIHPTVATHGAALQSIPENQQTPAMKMWMAQMTAPRPWFDPGPDVTASLQATEQEILRDFSKNPARLQMAVLNRWEWIRGRQRAYSAELFKAWRQCLEGLRQKSLDKVKDLDGSQLLRVMKSSGGKWKVYELCRKHVAEHGWSAEEAAGFREWISKLGTSATDNTYRAKAEWFLWFEDVLPIDPDVCWGERVRKDLRAMKEEERRAWVALLGDGAFQVAAKPSKKWLQAATAAFPKVGAAVFRRRFKAWFAPFAAGEPLRLTVTGRNVLRLLMWSALIARDPAVDDALAGFSRVEWKTKENARRAAQAEMAFSFVLAERSPQKALPILEEMVRSGRAFEGSASYQTYRVLCLDAGRRPLAAAEVSRKK